VDEYPVTYRDERVATFQASPILKNDPIAASRTNLNAIAMHGQNACRIGGVKFSEF
jgi:hypothetical protein